MDLKGIVIAAREARWMWLLVILGIATSSIMKLFAPGEAHEFWMATGNWVIAAGHIIITLLVAPYFKVDAETKLGAIIFFAMAAAMHIELGVHSLSRDGLTSSDMVTWHMLLIHTIQPIALWRFVLGLQRANIVDDDTLSKLDRASSQRTRSTDA